MERKDGISEEHQMRKQREAMRPDPGTLQLPTFTSEASHLAPPRPAAYAHIWIVPAISEDTKGDGVIAPLLPSTTM